MLQEIHEVTVPCNGCTACCRGRAIRPLYPERGDVVEDYEHQHVGGVPALAWSEGGDCVYVGPGGCTIHARRPALCRGYDCRVGYLSLTRQQRRADARARPYQRAIYRAARRLLESKQMEVL